MPVDPELLEPHDRLIEVIIEGRKVRVPENNTVLRVLQYLDIDLYPCRLCWNGECNNCFVDYLAADGSQQQVRGCATIVVEGMEITRIPTNAVWPAAVPGDEP